ncbi:MAG: carboxylating nicotinate-nucleotide diphosphorylase [Candidatus Acidiferrales bacterium]
MNWDSPEIAALIRAALDEDLGFGRTQRPGDVTSLATISEGVVARAQIIAKQDVVLAGLPLAERVFRALDPKVRLTSQAQDGAAVAAATAVLRVEGNARAMLGGERTALNFLAHLSGIARLTRRFVDAIAGTPARIRDTRKTTPLHRALEKYAVRTGGGSNHRFGLFDAVLIKENHIVAAGGVREALRRAQEHVAALEPVIPTTTAYGSFAPSVADAGEAPRIVIQIEVRNEAELREALAAGARSILLDNQSPESAATLIAMARGEAPQCTIEVSGGVTLSNVRAYAEAGCDFIAIGALTHSAPAADFTLFVERAGIR